VVDVHGIWSIFAKNSESLPALPTGCVEGGFAKNAALHPHFVDL